MILLTYDPIFGLRVVYVDGPFLRLPVPGALRRVSRPRKPKNTKREER